MPITPQQLSQIIPDNQYVDQWCEALNKFLPDYKINTVQREAAFLSQCAHESAGFTALQENLNYQAASLMRVWPTHFPTIEIATQYAHHPEQIADRAYANRMGNGDEASGDGWKFRGRGLIQLTGRSNYTAFGNTVNMTPDQVIEYVQTFDGAVQTACWFWNTNNLNQYADVNNIQTITQRINGGLNGLDDRIARYNLAQQALGA
jgi:putative chitinase